MLEEDGRRVFLGGNIGIAPTSFLPDLQNGDWVVLELSSFQLEGLGRSPRLSAITNLSREHLAPADPLNPNYHRSFDDYWLAKAEIFRHQSSDGWLVAPPDLRERIDALGRKERVLFFDSYQGEMKLIGEHNRRNAAAAAMLAGLAGVPDEAVARAAASFSGLEHRLEMVAVKKGISYYDDSFATTPEATITALRSFGGDIILLAGGAEKNSDFGELAEEIKKRVKKLVLFEGAATPRLQQAVLEAGFDPRAVSVSRSMPEAFSQALASAEPADTVLLSAACASFGVFKNYKQRGDLFKKEVSRLPDL
jgi:UDP-N-acetylmuramoylalanine--D-glutamate ligase